MQFTASCNMGGFTSSTSSSFFQGGYLQEELVRKVQELGLTIERINEYELKELGVFIRREDSAKTIKKFISYLPQLSITYTLQPISASITKEEIYYIYVVFVIDGLE